MLLRSHWYDWFIYWMNEGLQRQSRQSGRFFFSFRDTVYCVQYMQARRIVHLICAETSLCTVAMIAVQSSNQLLFWILLKPKETVFLYLCTVLRRLSCAIANFLLNFGFCTVCTTSGYVKAVRWNARITVLTVLWCVRSHSRLVNDKRDERKAKSTLKEKQTVPGLRT